MNLALDIDEVESRVRSLAPLVKRIAKHIAASVPTSVDQGRLVQAGMNGLLDAARRFHGDPGSEFDTFAVPRIRREMIDSMQDSPPLAVDTRRKMRDAETAMERLARRKRRPPTDREVAEALGTSLEDYHGLLRGAQGYQIISYEDCDPENGDDPLEALNDPELREVVIKAIDALPESERLAMSLYHEHQLNHAEIGAVIGVSESRASEMYTQSIARIRVAIRGAELLAR